MTDSVAPLGGSQGSELTAAQSYPLIPLPMLDAAVPLSQPETRGQEIKIKALMQDPLGNGCQDLDKVLESRPGEVHREYDPPPTPPPHTVR